MYRSIQKYSTVILATAIRAACGGGGGGGSDYGGGGGRGTTVSSYQTNSGAGGKGAVRIIWGNGRSFPSTNTADV